MKAIMEGEETRRNAGRWRSIAGYVLGMLVEILAVAAISSAALLVMFLVKAVVR